MDQKDYDYIRDRITMLRSQRKISEYKMSLDLGHSKSYIQSISSGKSLPSMSEFMYICDYLDVTPKEFFDDEIKDPSQLNELYENAKKLDSEDLTILLSVCKRLNDNKK